MAYEGSVELISGIKTKNNGTFPLVDAPDIRVTDDLRLPGALDLKANLASPTFTGIPKSVTPSSSSNAKMIATKEYVDNAFTVNDAMLFKGTIGNAASGATVNSLPNTHKQGWTYKVITAGSYAGKQCEIGDMIICVTDGTAASNDDWTVVQTNIDGAVTGPVSSTDGNVALFNGNGGKVIKDGGTIQSLIIKDDASGVEALMKVWSAQKSINELAKKVNETDLFAGIDIYDPNSASQGQFTFNADAYAHQAGTKYIVHNTGDGVYVIPPASLESACLSYERYTLTEYVQHLEAPKASPEFTGSISLGRKSDTTSGSESIAVGYDVEASGTASTALGWSTKASTDAAHAEGYGTQAVSPAAHAEGYTTKAAGEASHSEGYGSLAEGAYSHAEGNGTLANHRSQHVFGENNQMDSSLESATARGDYVEIVGNGTGNYHSNARALDWDGNEHLMGDLYVGCSSDSTGGNKVISDLDIMAIYTGVSEYTPVADVSFAPGIFYRQIGANYIGMLKGDSSLEIFLNSGTYQIPSESDNNWDIMYFGDPRLKEAMIFPLEGITEYTPVSDAHFGTSSAYHEVGSKYICVTKDNTLIRYSEGGYPGAGGGYGAGVTNGVYHLPRSSDSNVDVYTIGQFLHAWRTKRVSQSSPVLSDDLSIVGAKLSRAQLLTLLGLTNDGNAYATPPTTIKLGSTTLTETQLQQLLAMLT